MRIRKREDASGSSETQPQPDHHHWGSRLMLLPLGDVGSGTDHHEEQHSTVDINTFRSAAGNWRKALLGRNGREFHAGDEVERAGETVEWTKLNGSIRMQGKNDGIASEQAMKTEESTPKETTSNISSEEGNGDDVEWEHTVKSRRLAENSPRREHSVVQYHGKGKYSPVFTMPLKKRKRTKQAPIRSHDEKFLNNTTIPKDEQHSSVKVSGKEIKSEQTGVVTELRASKAVKCTSHVGSRCRRMNGRGWRCSQRTLVGYALCEHHLGKGRLKSINNNASVLDDRAKAKEVNQSHGFMLSNPIDDNYDKHHAKKRVVKARSLKLISL